MLDEHLADNDEILPHVLMADLTRWFVAAVAAGQPVDCFAAAVEVLYTSPDEQLRNVVGVSFMEILALGPDDRELAAIEALGAVAGPATIADLKVYRG
ncbi:MAG: hypothetical protein J2P15_03020 [Micromonosporaceae bacterium]|nr:hypothetical protein [Micromonosporaceae bacterium]